jgi:putative membrane protein
MAERKKSSYSVGLVIRIVLNILLIWFLATNLDEYLIITGGWIAYIVVGSLLTLLNIFIRPILNILSIPLRLFATVVGIMLVNGLFLWLITYIVDRMDPSIVKLSIRGGIGGWVVLSVILGVANWLMKIILRT